MYRKTGRVKGDYKDWANNSLVLRSRPAFHHLQYENVRKGHISDIEGREKVERTSLSVGGSERRLKGLR